MVQSDQEKRVENVLTVYLPDIAQTAGTMKSYMNMNT